MTTIFGHIYHAYLSALLCYLYGLVFIVVFNVTGGLYLIALF